jgi:hypothetical protein
MKVTTKIFSSFLILLLILSCQEQNNKYYSYKLIFDTNLSDVNEKSLIIDSLIFNKHNKDSIFMEKCSNGKCFQFTFLLSNGEFYERRYSFNDVGDFFGIDSILTFSKRDTSFIYKSEYEFIPIVQSYSYADCKYTIRKTGNDFVTEKQSLIDTTYKEIFFYDKDYHIYKFINTWKDNTCVYVKKD